MALSRRTSRRRPLALTSLIDVIFLLLLFFMLSSTFTRFAEIPVSAALAGAGAPTTSEPPLFLRLSDDELLLNGQAVPLTEIAGALLALDDGSDLLLISLTETVSTQRLTDLLVRLPASEDLTILVLD
ncbi:MAG: biopolymer transporter ExbD [Pseudomonadota bacterium]